MSDSLSKDNGQRVDETDYPLKIQLNYISDDEPNFENMNFELSPGIDSSSSPFPRHEVSASVNPSRDMF